MSLFLRAVSSLITSQIDTAPKPRDNMRPRREGLITSQIDTAPKQLFHYIST